MRLINKTIMMVITALLVTSAPLAAGDITSEKGPGGRSITAFDRTGERQIGGYFDTEWHALKDGTHTFKAHRYVLEASSQVHEKILVNAEIEFEYGGFLKAGSSTTKGELKMEQAWVDFEFTDELYFRGGIVVLPFGLVNVLHDSDVRDTTNRPIYAKYIVPSTWMDTGVGLHGLTEMDDLHVNYSLYMINGLGTGISSSKGVRDARPNFKADNNQGSAMVGHVGVSPMLGLEVGGSMYTGKYSDDNQQGITLLGFDVAYKTGPWEGVIEYAQASIDNINNMNGYYIEGRYHFFPEFLKGAFFAKGFAHPGFTLFGRYGAVDLDTSVIGKDDKSQLTIGMNYRPHPTVVFKIEGELNTENGDKQASTGIISSIAVGF